MKNKTYPICYAATCAVVYPGLLVAVIVTALLTAIAAPVALPALLWASYRPKPAAPIPENLGTLEGRIPAEELPS